MTAIRVCIDGFRFAGPAVELLYFLDDLNAWPPAKFTSWAKRLGAVMKKPGHCVVTLEGDDEQRELTTLTELLELREAT